MRYLIFLFMSFLKPIIKKIGSLKLPWTHKKINGDHYYLWRDKIEKGMVFLTTILGEPSNLLNPCKYKHGALYFGKGLKSAINKRITELEKIGSHQEIITRLRNILLRYRIKDEICYVLESTGKGVVPTGLVRFITTKDRIKILSPTFANQKDSETVCENAIDFLGLGYDYNFTLENEIELNLIFWKKKVKIKNTMYCFEFVIKSFLTRFSIDFKKYKTLNVEQYTDKTFKDDNLWKKVIDSSDAIWKNLL